MSANPPLTAPLTALSHPLRVADLATRKPNRFDIVPGAAERESLARELNLLSIGKLRLVGILETDGRHDWALSAKLTARVVQACVVTTDPVTTEISEPVMRRFMSDLPDANAEGEIEMPEDETLELLGRFIDPGQVMQEALALALPLYPRHDGAALGSAVFAQPGVEPLTDEALRPFAGLSDLRDRLKK